MDHGIFTRLLEVVRCTIPVNRCTAHVQDELAQQVIKAMCRKFPGSAKVALRAYGHAAQAGDGEGARKALGRSLTSLQKRKHIKARPIPAAGAFEVHCDICRASCGRNMYASWQQGSSVCCTKTSAWRWAGSEQEAELHGWRRC